MRLVKPTISGIALLVLLELSLYSSSFPIKPPVNLLRNLEFAIWSNIEMARLDHVKAARIIAPTIIKLIPRTASKQSNVYAYNLTWEIWCPMFVRRTVVTSKITAPIPPATLIRNSNVWMPRTLERLFDVGTSWSLR